MTSYFLPWLALTAQLPFENEGVFETLMGLCLAIGSPALITYSLAITIFNRNWAIASVKRLFKRSRQHPGQRFRHFEDRLESFLFLAIEGQQVPLRATGIRHWLSSLIVSPLNQPWWTNLKGRINRSRRKSTYSLHAQLALAGFVWVFTIGTSIAVATGSVTTAVEIAASTLWVWLVGTYLVSVLTDMELCSACAALIISQIPVTWGWIWVGTQYDKGSITIFGALQNVLAHRVLGPNDYAQGRRSVREAQQGILVESGLTRQPRPGTESQLEPVGSTPPELPWTMIMDVRGDERHEGPVYNYARVFTWWAFTQRILDGFEASLLNMELERRVDNMPETGPATDSRQQGQERPTNQSTQTQNSQNQDAQGHQLQDLQQQTQGQAPQSSAQPQPAQPQGAPQPAQNHGQGGFETALMGNAPQTSHFCGMQHPKMFAYAGFRRMPGELYLRIVLAAAIAFFAQWGTTGAAIIIAYYTPAVGFGCRSGSYALYGILGTAVLIFLILSKFFSHQAMKQYQAAYSDDPHIDFRNSGNFRWTRWVFCVLANSTRLFAKILAVVNTVILILIEILEFIGLFDNCWCKACHLQYGDKSWVVLFRSDADYQKIGQSAWIGGIAMATIVFIILCCIFGFGRRSLEELNEIDATVDDHHEESGPTAG